MAEKDAKPRRIAAENRKARFEYAIADTFEAGIALQGSEVKSLRAGKATIGESYAAEKNGELFLVNAYIPEYLEAHQFNHETKRPRKLLLHRRQVDKLVGALSKALDDPAIKARYVELGSSAPQGVDRGPGGLQKLVEVECEVVGLVEDVPPRHRRGG